MECASFLHLNEYWLVLTLNFITRINVKICLTHVMTSKVEHLTKIMQNLAKILAWKILQDPASSSTRSLRILEELLKNFGSSWQDPVMNLTTLFHGCAWEDTQIYNIIQTKHIILKRRTYSLKWENIRHKQKEDYCELSI